MLGSMEEALANRVHSEIEWLRRGARRAPEIKARIGKAENDRRAGELKAERARPM